MSNEAEAKVEIVEEPTKAVTQIIQGEVTINLREDGALQVNGPQNVLLALAIIKAGEVYLMKNMQDAMRRAETLNSRPPVIARPTGDFTKFAKPS